MNVIPIKYEDEMKKSYIDYAMSVIVQRALPDVRDGLKPVHRRILYSMKELGNFHDKPHKKSARIVGDVLGKYHPHGDSSVYDAMVRLAQDFNMQAPLVDGHGNFGSIDGDSAAAMRYTEARLSPIAIEMLKDLDMGVVDMMANFDNTLKEPTVLPTRFPHLLVNGSSGIAVGMATSIPPHNLKEVINAAMALMDKPDMTDKSLLKHIKGPDFPTGGILANEAELAEIYETGRGKMRVRAKIGLDKEYKRSLVVTEVPYTLAGNKTKVIEDIINLMNERRMDEVTDIRDESSKDGLRIIIEMKKGVNPEALIQKLYKMTKLEDTFGVNLLAIKDKHPISFSLKGMLQEYVLFLKEIHEKRLRIELGKATNRKEILDGLIRATDVIDLIIEVIRGSKNLKTVKDCLVFGKTDGIAFKSKKSEKEAMKLNFTEVQATAILVMQLQRLVGLEIEKLEAERAELSRKIDELEAILATEESLNAYIKEDLKRIRKEYGVPRRTQISELPQAQIIEEEVVSEEVYILIDKFNYLKVVDASSYNRMNQEGLDTVIPIQNDGTLRIFTSDGMVHQIKIKDIPFSKSKDRGTPLDLLVDIKGKEMLCLTASTDNVLFATLKGLVKRVDGIEFESRYKSLKATKLNDGDKLISVQIIPGEVKEVLLTTKESRYLRFNLEEIPVQKKTAAGVVGINLNADDCLDKIEFTLETEEKKRKRGSKGIVA